MTDNLEIDKRFDCDGLNLEWLLSVRSPVSVLHKEKGYSYSSGIYFLFDKDELVYIGKSKNVRNRIQQHIEDNKKVFDSFVRMSIEDDTYISEMEETHIFKYYPKYNKQLRSTVTPFVPLGTCFHADEENQKIFFRGIILDGKLHVNKESIIYEHELRFEIPEEEDIELWD